MPIFIFKLAFLNENNKILVDVKKSILWGIPLLYIHTAQKMKFLIKDL